MKAARPARRSTTPVGSAPPRGAATPSGMVSVLVIAKVSSRRLEVAQCRRSGTEGGLGAGGVRGTRRLGMVDPPVVPQRDALLNLKLTMFRSALLM